MWPSLNYFSFILSPCFSSYCPGTEQVSKRKRKHNKVVPNGKTFACGCKFSGCKSTGLCQAAMISAKAFCLQNPKKRVRWGIYKGKTKWGHGEKMATCKIREVPEENSPADILIIDLQLPELWKINVCCLSPSPCHKWKHKKMGSQRMHSHGQHSECNCFGRSTCIGN